MILFYQMHIIYTCHIFKTCSCPTKLQQMHLLLVINDELLVVRTCVLEDISSGGVQCGTFRFQGNPANHSEEEIMKGCILTCDYDGCNHAAHARLKYQPYLLMFVLSFKKTLDKIC